MSEIEGVQGVGDSKEELQKYQEDYQKGLDIFKKSFQEYSKKDIEDHKKKAMENVMKEALQVMNETACVALKEGKQGTNKALNTDFHSYVNDRSPENKDKVLDDIKTLSE